MAMLLARKISAVVAMAVWATLCVENASMLLPPSSPSFVLFQRTRSTRACSSAVARIHFICGPRSASGRRPSCACWGPR